MREKGDHGQHHAGKETEHGNRLQNVEQRNHDHFGAARAGREIAESQSKDQTDGVGDDHAHQRVQGVKRKVARILRNLRLGMSGTEPGVANGVDSKNGGKYKQKNSDIDQQSPGRARTGRARRGGRMRCGVNGGERRRGHGGLTAR